MQLQERRMLRAHGKGGGSFAVEGDAGAAEEATGGGPDDELSF